MKTCIFCGSRGPFSGEHVLPEWTARLIGVEPGVRLQVRGQKYDEPARTWGAVGTFGQVVRSVCELNAPTMEGASAEIFPKSYDPQ